MSTPQELLEELTKAARDMGATFVGVADLTPAKVQDFMAAQLGSDELRKYTRGVSVGIALANGIVEQLPNARHQDDRGAAHAYQNMYDVVNRQLEALTLRLAGVLQEAGYRALPAPVARTLDVSRRVSYVSNKLSAHLAGLGWIGKSCLVITPRVGPRARWATVLTDAPLPAGTPLDEQCGDCNLCVENCPAGAYTGRNFNEDEPREARMMPERCAEYRAGRKEALGESICGMCVYICPHGRKGQKPGSVIYL